MADRRPIRILGNTRELIEVLADRGALTPAEIAEITGIPRSSVYRLAEGLAVIGLTTTTSDSRIALSLRWLHLADAAFDGMREWASAAAALRDVTSRTDQTAFLTVPRGDEAVCIAWSPGRGIGVLILKPGRALPLFAGAAGRVMLAEHADLDSYLAASPFERFTPRTLVTEEELRADVDRTRSAGFAHSDEDATVGIGALGVPIRDASGRLAGCVSLAGTAEDIREHLDEFVAVLQGTATALATARDEAMTNQ